MERHDTLALNAIEVFASNPDHAATSYRHALAAHNYMRGFGAALQHPGRPQVSRPANGRTTNARIKQKETRKTRKERKNDGWQREPLRREKKGKPLINATPHDRRSPLNPGSSLTLRIGVRREPR